MKKFLFTILGLALALGATAEPAHPEPYVAHNADGSTVTVRLVGDEFYHFNTTSDGYTVMRNADGNFVYAQKQNGRLVPTVTIAHDEGSRDAGERALLATLGKRLTDEQGVTRSKQARSRRDTRMRAERSFDPSSFRGLVILVRPVVQLVRLVGRSELPGHPYYVGTQAHPEFKSRPNKAHPLFFGLIRAALENKADS